MLLALKNMVQAALLYLLLCVGTFLMAFSIIRYTAMDDHVGFLQFKQEYLHLPLWKAAFYTHVFSSIFTLLAGFSQFWKEGLRHYPKLHRWIGRIYVADILLLNVPAAFVMAIYANGGLSSKCAFLLLDGLWCWFTLQAWRKAKARDFKAHRRFMIRSYALTLSAICLRSWKLVFVGLSTLDLGTIYRIDAWMGFVPNLFVAEWIIRHGKKTSAQKKPLHTTPRPIQTPTSVQ